MKILKSQEFTCYYEDDELYIEHKRGAVTPMFEGIETKEIYKELKAAWKARREYFNVLCLQHFDLKQLKVA